MQKNCRIHKVAGDVTLKTCYDRSVVHAVIAQHVAAVVAFIILKTGGFKIYGTRIGYPGPEGTVFYAF